MFAHARADLDVVRAPLGRRDGEVLEAPKPPGGRGGAREGGSRGSRAPAPSLRLALPARRRREGGDARRERGRPDEAHDARALVPRPGRRAKGEGGARGRPPRDAGRARVARGARPGREREREERRERERARRRAKPASAGPRGGRGPARNAARARRERHASASGVRAGDGGRRERDDDASESVRASRDDARAESACPRRERGRTAARGWQGGGKGWLRVFFLLLSCALLMFGNQLNEKRRIHT